MDQLQKWKEHRGISKMTEADWDKYDMWSESHSICDICGTEKDIAEFVLDEDGDGYCPDCVSEAVSRGYL